MRLGGVRQVERLVHLLIRGKWEGAGKGAKGGRSEKGAREGELALLAL
jgi:hypothetical protein